MPLIDLRSDLRTLRYGSDRFGGGSSGQPYVTTPIPDYSASNSPSSPDFLLRNGYLNPQSTERDLERIGKFLTDPNGQGLFFITKQNLLARQNPRGVGGPDNIYLPTNTLAQIAGVSVGLHTPQLGVDPFLRENSKYEYQQLTNHNSAETNRLVLLKDLKLERSIDSSNRELQTFGISPDSNQILNYVGGANSFLSLTRTVLPRDVSRRGNTEDKTPINRAVGFNYEQLGTATPVGEFGEPNLISIEDYRKKIAQNNRDMPFSDYVNFNRERTYNTGNPGARYKEATLGISGVDILNAQPIFSSSTAPDFANRPELNDIIKFYISVVNNDNPLESDFIFFRAFLDSFSDSFQASWNSYKFVGRGEDFYSYNGFGRSMNLSFKIACQSAVEKKALYQKLNYLQSVMAPDYSSAGIARGNIVKLTVGDYITDLYGVIDNLSFDIPVDSNWDIGRDATGALTGLQLPNYITVSTFSFKPIHNFLPRRTREANFTAAPFISAIGTNTYQNL
jgi:hypothetical protein